VELDQDKQVALDAVLDAYAGELDRARDELSAVTLAYTHTLHRAWRTALRLLPVSVGASVLDVGSGLGVLAFELASNLRLEVLGVDIEPRFVEHSTALRDCVGARGLFADGATVRFRLGDICGLELEDETFDLVFVRELLQFLSDPVQAVGEVHRVLKPGGYACISDTDDQLHITWPARSPALERMVGAVSDLQQARGGDRHCGRKLSTYLRRAGFDIASVVILPEAQHRLVTPSEGERALVLQQLRSARRRIVQAGARTAESFDTDLATLEAEDEHEEFRMNARVIVLARKTGP
jgi:ubiquinone/menaquinone biosynthesis C-methylase UbiE